mmetsp:Transcript_69953/g.197381  ORF Transcript_69953/g.197381 Transcript_69953/m.197381 type:complete len:497 (+) Transcript_69953:181-1671(+)
MALESCVSLGGRGAEAWTEKTTPTSSSLSCSWIVRTSMEPGLYMRNLVPSSALLSKMSLADFSASRDGARSGQGRSTPPREDAPSSLPEMPSCLTSNEDVQDDGNSGPASSSANSVLRKWSFLFVFTSSSLATSTRSLSTYDPLVTGGVKSRPSLRLSERWGLKTFRSRRLSTSLNNDLDSSPLKTLDQKASPTGAAVSMLCTQLPDTGFVSSISNWSRLRSTPFGVILGVMAAGTRARVGTAACWRRRGPPLLLLKLMALRRAAAPFRGCGATATVPGAAACCGCWPGSRYVGADGAGGPYWRSAVSTPPYTPMTPPSPPHPPPSVSSTRPSLTLIFLKQRSFHSWGISAQSGGASSLSRLNQDSLMSRSASIKNFASAVAFTTSRSWCITLFRSAIRSKLPVKSSAYLTSGWSALVMGLSSRPPADGICSRASTPILQRGTSTSFRDMWTAASRTTNHSRAVQSLVWPSSSEKSKPLLMPATGCVCSPIESSFR